MKAESGILEKLEWIQDSLPFFSSELILVAGTLLVIAAGISIPSIRSGKDNPAIPLFAGVFLAISLGLTFGEWNERPVSVPLFLGMVRSDNFSGFLKTLCDGAALAALLMSCQKGLIRKHNPEYAALLLSAVLGAHLLVMSTNLVMVFVSLELISISSYVLAGFSFQRQGAEGSLKYFMFGAVASAVMVYGFSLIYGLTGTLDFSSPQFADQLLRHETPLVIVACLLSLAGFLFKMAAPPMHPWAPDVYEAAPMPIVAFFSVVPKLAGLGVLTRFVFALSSFGQSPIDWQFVIGIVSIVTISLGNLAALRQTSPKRMMAYSSIAQSGFLLIGVTAFMPQAVHFMLFYATVYTAANFLVFYYFQVFETRGIFTIQEFSGSGRSAPVQNVFLTVGFISLTGLPPTAGFTAKFLVFSSLWESYQVTGKSFLIWLLVIGLLNTVISLFYYVRIPVNAFLKPGTGEPIEYLTWKNLFGLILVMVILLFFFQPNLLMGWINRINFVL